MDERNTAATARKRGNGLLIVGAIAVLFAAAILVFAVTAGTSTTPTSVAEGVVPITDVQQKDTVANHSPQVVAAGSAIANSAAEAMGETIADEETPLSAYPGQSNTGLFGAVSWVLLAAIAAAAVFFILSTRRLNRDITHMKSSIH